MYFVNLQKKSKELMNMHPNQVFVAEGFCIANQSLVMGMNKYFQKKLTLYIYTHIPDRTFLPFLQALFLPSPKYGVVKNKGQMVS
jgi:hypothetical protein